MESEDFLFCMEEIILCIRFRRVKDYEEIGRF